MTTGNPDLIATIRSDIEKKGPISFARFMEHALYDPQHGFYASGRARLGREGDYFTNVSVGPAFGQLVAQQMIEMWQALGKPEDFVMVEQGAHHGDFARDVLQWLSVESRDLFGALRYRIVEPSPVLKERQGETLADCGGKVEWAATVDGLNAFRGVFFANELLDAFPVHCLSLRQDAADEWKWVEKFVTANNDEGSAGLANEGQGSAGLANCGQGSAGLANCGQGSAGLANCGQFIFSERPLSDPGLVEYVNSWPAIGRPFEAEVAQGVQPWMRGVSSKLLEGFVLLIDYGFSTSDRFAAERAEGTLQVRQRHRLLESPFLGIGEADITSHVDWDWLIGQANDCGLKLAGLTDQYHFLTGILSRDDEFIRKASPKIRREVQTLLHPEMLGRSFQAVILGRNIPEGTILSGLRFAARERAGG